jgi:hypothetical protein
MLNEIRRTVTRSALWLALVPMAMFLAACEDEGNPGDDNLLTGGSLILVVIVVAVVVVLLMRRRR